jgi:hypothetical protein
VLMVDPPSNIGRHMFVLMVDPVILEDTCLLLGLSAMSTNMCPPILLGQP